MPDSDSDSSTATEMQTMFYTDPRPLAIYYEHPDWFRPLFEELDRRGTPYVALDASAHRYDASEEEVPYSLLFNRMSPSAYLRGGPNRARFPRRASGQAPERLLRGAMGKSKGGGRSTGQQGSARSRGGLRAFGSRRECQPYDAVGRAVSATGRVPKP